SPAHLGGADHFASEVKCTVDFMRSCPLVEGAKAITLPGDPELNTLADRSTNGVPFDDGNWKALAALGEKLGAAVPVVV
ncbi:MAG TPA: Ldh family oxidoreductase, partial [Pirellulales bacterium]